MGHTGACSPKIKGRQSLILSDIGHFNMASDSLPPTSNHQNLKMKWLNIGLGLYYVLTSPPQL